MALSTKLWTPTDTTSKLTTSGGKLNWAAGLAAWGDPAVAGAYSLIRMAGLTLEFEITPTSGTWHFGMHSSGTLTQNIANYIRSTGTNLVAGIGATQPVLPVTLSAGTSYRFRLVFKAAGCLWYYSTDSGKTWYAIWEEATTSDATLYAMLNSNQFVGSNGVVVVFKGALTDPVISTTPAAPTPSLGADVAVNGVFAADTNWTKDAGWSIAAGAASVATDGNVSIYQETLTIGAWYKLSVGLTALTNASGISFISVAGTPIGPTFSAIQTHALYCRATTTTLGIMLRGGAAGKTATIDNVKAEPYTLASLLSSAGDAGSKYGIFDFAVTVGATYQAGGLFCLDDAATPANYLHAYVDQTDGKAYLLKVVGGVTTELIGTAITYGAADQLRVVVSPGTSGLSNAQVALYYDGAKIGDTQTVDLTNMGTLARSFDTSGAATVAVTANV